MFSNSIIIIIIIIIINTEDSVYGAVTTVQALQEFTRSIQWMSDSAESPSTHRPSALASISSAVAIYCYYSS